jgi:hypothetical protein
MYKRTVHGPLEPEEVKKLCTIYKDGKKKFSTQEDHLFGPSSTLSNAALVRFHLEEDFDGCGAQDDKGVWDDEGSDDEGTGV